jgi:hypothetical protein
MPLAIKFPWKTGNLHQIREVRLQPFRFNSMSSNHRGGAASFGSQLAIRGIAGRAGVPPKNERLTMKLNCAPRNLSLTLCLCLPLLVGVTACERQNVRATERERTPGEAIDDKTLTASVRSALEADSVKYPDVQVAAYRGVIQLSGFVDTREHKGRANDVAKNIAGVRKVENNISVKEEKKP